MIGEILDAKYRIDKQLGAGGMGNVYLRRISEQPVSSPSK